MFSRFENKGKLLPMFLKASPIDAAEQSVFSEVEEQLSHFEKRTDGASGMLSLKFKAEDPGRGCGAPRPSSERRLLAAVLERAMLDLSSQNGFVRREAETWFLSDDTEDFSLHWILDMLGLLELRNELVRNVFQLARSRKIQMEELRVCSWERARKKATA